MQQAVRQRLAPARTDDLRTEHDIAQCARQTAGELFAPVDRKRQDVGRLVDAEMVALQRLHLFGTDEGKPELAVFDSLGAKHPPGKLDRSRLVYLDPAPVCDLDREHAQRLRSVPVSSACCLYASTMRCTSLCRTTSSWPNRMNAIPSISLRMSWTWMSPDAWSRGRSTCVTSPVTTTFEPKPRRVRNICICSGDVFCASSRMMKLSFSVRPRMNASGATSIVPRSRYVFAFSGSSMSYRASNSGRRYGSTFASMSPGRKPSRSPASTAGLVRMMRATCRSESAATASAIARYVLPGRADPERDRAGADRVHVGLLHHGLWRDLLAAVAPDDGVEHLADVLLGIE